MHHWHRYTRHNAHLPTLISVSFPSAGEILTKELVKWCQINSEELGDSDVTATTCSKSTQSSTSQNCSTVGESFSQLRNG